jgi:hypothetical protein
MMAHRMLFLLGASAAAASMTDVINVAKAAPAICTAGCARWSVLAEDGQTGVTQAAADAQWAAGQAPAGAGADCAIPGTSYRVSDEKANVPSSRYIGAWCYCKSSELSGYCQPRDSIVWNPEPSNLEL